MTLLPVHTIVILLSAMCPSILGSTPSWGSAPTVATSDNAFYDTRSVLTDIVLVSASHRIESVLMRVFFFFCKSSFVH